MGWRSRITAPLLLLSLAAAGCSSDSPGQAPSSASPTQQASTSASVTSPAPTTSSRTTARPKPAPKPSTSASTHKATPTPAPAKRTATKPAARRLPLGYSTSNADQVITVTARSGSSTTATLQAWRRVSGGWRTVGPSVPAYVGSAGIGHASEGSSRTPAGSFTLTQAFGHDSDPGTSLPYTHTNPDDWWISESGPLYNTRQRCSSSCSFDNREPTVNEHLYYETPYYNYAVVIDYNTRNAPGGVHQGAGSAFFLHVAVGEPTAGCVSIAQDQLVRLLRWLTPSRHPRILIGTD